MGWLSRRGWLIKRETLVSVGMEDLSLLEKTAEELVFDSPDHPSYFYAGLTLLEIEKAIKKRGITISQYQDLFEGERPFFVQGRYEFYFDRKRKYRLKITFLRRVKQPTIFPERNYDRISA